MVKKPNAKTNIEDETLEELLIRLQYNTIVFSLDEEDLNELNLKQTPVEQPTKQMCMDAVGTAYGQLDNPEAMQELEDDSWLTDRMWELSAGEPNRTLSRLCGNPRK